MVVKVYVSGISGNKEVKKRQQRVLMILDSRNITYEIVDIAEPGNEEQKDFMQNNSTSLGATVGDANPRHPLPPQIFNDTSYCGDYDQFDMSNEIDELEKFLKLAPGDSTATVTSNAEIKFENGKPELEGNVENEAEAKEPSPVTDNSVVPKDASVEAENTNGSENIEKAAPLSAEDTNGDAQIKNEEDGDETKAATVES